MVRSECEGPNQETTTDFDLCLELPYDQARSRDSTRSGVVHPFQVSTP